MLKFKCLKIIYSCITSSYWTWTYIVSIKQPKQSLQSIAASNKSEIFEEYKLHVFQGTHTAIWASTDSHRYPQIVCRPAQGQDKTFNSIVSSIYFHVIGMIVVNNCFLIEKSIMLIPVKTMMDGITGGKHLSAFLNNNVKFNSAGLTGRDH